MNRTPLTTAQRRTQDHTVKKHDYITAEQCGKLAAGIAEKVVAQAIADHERAKREARWYRRLLAWLRRERIV